MTEDVWLPDWNAELYASNTGHHRAYDDWFLAATPLQDDHRLVDLGCGSGDFTRTMADRVPGGEVVGVDPQPGFLEEARRRAGPNQRFSVGTGQNLVAALNGEQFDGVVSRAALQWVPREDQRLVVDQVFASIRDGGFFRLDMGGAGNIGSAVEVLDSLSAEFDGPSAPWCFPDAGWYLELLESAGFDLHNGHVRTVAQRRPFTEESLRGWLDSQVLQAYETGIDPRHHAEFRSRAHQDIGRFRRHDGSYDQTYVRLDALAWVPAIP